MHDRVLGIGSAVVDITPDKGVHLSGSGMGEHRPCETIADRLCARVVAFHEGSRKCCLVSLDTCIVTEEVTCHIRDAAESRFGLPSEALMLHALQIHSAPSLGRFMLDPDFPLETDGPREFLWGCESAYVEPAVEAVIEGIGQALADCRSVSLSWGRGVRTDLAYNRREEGAIDPAVTVVVAHGDAGRPVLSLLHYTCHPVNVFLRRDWRTVSADWPGAWIHALQAMSPACGIPVVINGCCGNINPGPYGKGHVWDHVKQGSELGHTSAALLEDLRPCAATPLSWASHTIRIPLREVPAERLAEVKQILADSPTPRLLPDGSGKVDPEWFLAASTHGIALLAERDPGGLPYEIQVFRVGDVAIVGLPGEPFVDAQLALKEASPSEVTLVAHCVGHYAGYLPTAEAAARGGHEANDKYTYWAKLVPDALAMVSEEALRMIGDLWA